MSLPKCPKCNIELEESNEDYESMSEGQQANFDAGFERSFWCSQCHNIYYFDIEPLDIEDDEEDLDELVEIIRVTPENFEEIIENALSSKCYVEAISLIHNVIEGYLKYKLELHFASDRDKLALIKEGYLKDYSKLCFIIGIVDRELFKIIIQFNSDRNRIIHGLLKRTMQMSELRAIARRGREIQMKLSPLNHNESDVNRIMAEFDRLTE